MSQKHHFFVWRMKKTKFTCCQAKNFLCRQGFYFRFTADAHDSGM